MKKIIFKNNGYTLIELLFYISLFLILSILLINSLFVMARSFKETTIYSQFSQNAVVIEKMSREIRQAYEINSISTSDLKLDTTDSAGVNKTVEFVLVGGDVQFLENNVLTGNLNTQNTTVTSLSFTEITTTIGKAVKISMSIKSDNDAEGQTQDFYDTVVLRGVY